MKRLLFTSFVAATLAAVSSADLLYFVEDSTNSLRTVDTGTLTVNTIGTLGTSGFFGDLAYDHSAGVMYFLAGRNDDNLYTVDLTTGAATLVGNHAVSDLFALGWDPVSGGLFAHDTNGDFWSLDSTSGAATLVGNNGVYSGGMTYDSSQSAMLISAPGSTKIFSVDLTDGSATLLGGSISLNDNDIAYSSASSTLFAMDYNGDLVSYDGSYTGSLLGGGFGDVASVEAVPEPATLTLLGLGALLAMRKRKLNA